jgi:hypothetical protein
MSFRARGRTISRRSRGMLDLDVEKQMLSLSAICKLHVSVAIFTTNRFQKFAITITKRNESLDDVENVVPTFGNFVGSPDFVLVYIGFLQLFVF